MTLHLLAALSNMGSAPSVVSRNISRTVSEIGRFRSRKVRAALSLIFRFGSILLRTKPDVCIFFITNRPASFLLDCVLLLMSQAFPRMPLIFYVHTHGWRNFSSRNLLIRSLCRTVFKRATVVVCLSREMQKELSVFRSGTTMVIPNTTPAAAPVSKDFKDLTTAVTPRFTIVFLANNLPDKGLRDFLQIAKYVALDHPNVDFVAAGDLLGQDRALDALVDNLHLRGRVTLLGRINEHDRHQVLARANLLLFPSTYEYEAQPLAIIEAKAAGVPTLAYDVGSVRELLGTQRGGWVIPPGNLDQMAAGCYNLLGNPLLLTELSREALRDFDERFTPQVFAENWSKCIRLAIASRDNDR